LENEKEGETMSKIKIDSGGAFLYSMLMGLVAAVVGEKVNFMAAAWVSRVNFNPPLFLIALGLSASTSLMSH
jgi:flavin reductase (DIM6/NTAB) family NADH-FMN oxidoreductase RutF